MVKYGQLKLLISRLTHYQFRGFYYFSVKIWLDAILHVRNSCLTHHLK